MCNYIKKNIYILIYIYNITGWHLPVSPQDPRAKPLLHIIKVLREVNSPPDAIVLEQPSRDLGCGVAGPCGANGSVVLKLIW